MDDEQKIIERVQRGDKEAFAELVDMHLRQIRTFVALKVPFPDMIDVITHETFVFAYENIHDFRPRGAFAGWLTAIARNLILSELQRMRRERANQMKYAEQKLVDISERNAGIEGRDVRMEYLQKCLQRVPAAVRRLLDMKYTDGLSAAEAAAEFKKTPSWARTTLCRIRQQLKDCVDSYLSGAGA